MKLTAAEKAESKRRLKAYRVAKRARENMSASATKKGPGRYHSPGHRKSKPSSVEPFMGVL